MPRTTYIALLRGINVGGHKKIAMADLRDLAAGLGLTRPQTILQSGNLVFESVGRTAADLERLLEAETERRMGVSTVFLVRTAAQWANAISRNPFPKHAASDPGHLLLMYLKAAPGVASVTTLQTAISGRELLRASGAELYVVYPDGVGRSRLTHTLIERTLGTRGTARNWNTVLKLAAAAGVS